MANYSMAGIVTDGPGEPPRLYHKEIAAEDAAAAQKIAATEMAGHVAARSGREVRREVGVKEVPDGHTSVAVAWRNSVGDTLMAHGTSDRAGPEVRADLERNRPEQVPRGYRLDQISTVDAADRTREMAQEAGRVAGRAVDAYEASRHHMGADAARERALWAVPKAVAEERGLKGEEAQRFESSAAKAGQSALSHYGARLEEGFTAGEARSSAVVAAREGHREAQRERGTMDVARFSSGAIETYATHAPHRGEDAARKGAVLAAAENASALHGVNVTRAGRVAEGAIDAYVSHRQQGASHEAARDTAAGEMAYRYDERGQRADRQQERPRERSRGGMSL